MSFMSVVFQSIALFICFHSIGSFRRHPNRNQFSVSYSHSINDCLHLCFGVESCIEDCEQGYVPRGRRPPERPRRRQMRPRYEAEEEDYDRPLSPISYYGSDALKEAVDSKPKPKTKEKELKNFASLRSQPTHCGYRYKSGGRQGSGAAGMERIVGGEDAEPHEFPWLVSLQLKKEGKSTKHFCGGAIINEYYILTAAHCTDSLRGKEDTVVIKAGINSMKDKGQVLISEKFIVHDGWSADNQMNDIALIRLKTPVKYTINNLGQYTVNAVCLPPDSTEPNGYAQLAGWGQLSEEDTKESEWLQKINLPIWDRQRCKKNYIEYMRIQRAHICAGGRGGHDSCMGDSGGPLTQTRGSRSYQIGLVSFGIPCAVKGLPGVYSWLVYYMNWINSNMI